ncbi:hypothetical protein I79_013688 [Cricetulus griseus]|uniref:Uncharacterized protein n=1 Tax=Cricetulus griseus TaxID=10029 RepID=G3HS63_CRIGR|nr:hypothetical protein I79_013688 [Cricetulus griseus]
MVWKDEYVGRCVLLLMCLRSVEQTRQTRRAPSGGGTHGPVIISIFRSQEMHFTRSNSFLEDKEEGSQGLACPGLGVE